MIPIIVTSTIFVITLILIFSEKVNRTIVAIAGAVFMTIVGAEMGIFTQEKVTETVDFNTIGLLLGMMILVVLLEPTGFFQYLAIYASKLSKGNPARLLIILSIVTALLSMFLDNVTSVVLIVPITILICEIMGVSTIPFLMAEAILANTGGAATMVGDPPNILIASGAGLNFNDFLIHSLPIVFLVMGAVLLFLLRYFKTELEQTVEVNLEALNQLNPLEALKDKKTSIQVLLIIGVAILGFLLEEFHHFKPSTVALTAASLGLLIIRPDIKEVFKLISWDILIFFSSLFIMVGVMESAGVLQLLADVLILGIGIHPVLYGLVLLWIVAILAALIDNVPLTIALIPVIHSLAHCGIGVNHLWWALVFGAGFGGNGTILGSSANIVVVSLSEKTRTPITPLIWNRVGISVMFIACSIASVLYVLVYFTYGF